MRLAIANSSSHQSKHVAKYRRGETRYASIFEREQARSSHISRHHQGETFSRSPLDELEESSLELLRTILGERERRSAPPSGVQKQGAVTQRRARTGVPVGETLNEFH